MVRFCVRYARNTVELFGAPTVTLSCVQAGRFVESARRGDGWRLSNYSDNYYTMSGEICLPHQAIESTFICLTIWLTSFGLVGDARSSAESADVREAETRRELARCDANWDEIKRRTRAQGQQTARRRTRPALVPRMRPPGRPKGADSPSWPGQSSR